MESDGCTCWFDGTWRECCEMHDRRYANKRISRLQADILLFRCVSKRSVVMAGIMFVGVRLFGWLRYKED